MFQTINVAAQCPSRFAQAQHAALDRRTFLRVSGLGAAGWLTWTSQALARQAEQAPRGAPAWSVILLWMSGGPSQLETFDPKPGRKISADSKAIQTAVPGIQLGSGLGRVAEQMQDIALVRSLVSKEGDHERGTYLGKTGYVPVAALEHPSLGALICHELPASIPSGLQTEIPRHVSILPSEWPARGGFLGAEYDAFKLPEPGGRVPDVRSPITEKDRLARRAAGLSVLENSFAAGRQRAVMAANYIQSRDRAQKMMSSEQLAAFEVSEEPDSVKDLYGKTSFGLGCLTARRLTQRGVRCVEVNLTGWDSHANNHSVHEDRLKVLDPAFAGLIQDLKNQQLLDRTLVICAGEFGRTPQMNALAGRDHWPHGFSIALAGGGIGGGIALGETDPEGGKDIVSPYSVADIHATVHKLLGIDFQKELISPIQRPIKIAEGTPIDALIRTA